MKGAVEREVKLEAELSFTVPDLQDLVGETVRLPEENLWTTYFDTSDLRLWERKITLRHRVGEQPGTGIWTIKLPHSGSGPTLDRHELSWAGSPDVVPDAAMKVLRGLVRQSSLQEITRIETLRRRLTLQGHRDFTLGELDDDVVTIHGGPNDGYRFRQIELEVDCNDVELIERVLDRLRAAGARPGPVSGPKVVRALGRDFLEARNARPVGPEATMVEFVQANISGGLDRILDHEYLLRVDPADPPVHNVHQTRVASRRLRSDLKTFGAILDPLWVRHIRRDLKWVGASLGAVRDVDVLVDELGERLAIGSVDPTGYELFLSVLRTQRRSAALDLAEVLDSDRYILLLDKLHAATQRPPALWKAGQSGQLRASKALPRLVRRPWKKLLRQVQRAGSHPTDYELHRIRIRSKQLRYACEAASTVIGRPARKMAKAAERLQTELGNHHDAVEAEKWVRQVAAGGSEALVFSAGQLTSEERLRKRAASRHWRGDWRKIDRKSLYGWLR